MISQGNTSLATFWDFNAFIDKTLQQWHLGKPHSKQVSQVRMVQQNYDMVFHF